MDPGTGDELVNSQDAAGQTTDGQREGARAARHAPTSSVKALTLLVSGGWTGVHHPHRPPQLPASEIQQPFLSTSLACLLAFERQAARPRTHTLR